MSAEVEPWHGTANGYSYYSCRCDKCRQAMSEQNRKKYIKNIEKYRKSAREKYYKNIEQSRRSARERYYKKREDPEYMKRNRQIMRIGSLFQKTANVSERERD